MQFVPVIRNQNGQIWRKSCKSMKLLYIRSHFLSELPAATPLWTSRSIFFNCKRSFETNVFKYGSSIRSFCTEKGRKWRKVWFFSNFETCFSADFQCISSIKAQKHIFKQANCFYGLTFCVSTQWKPGKPKLPVTAQLYELLSQWNSIFLE